jgi:hypothetical protein
MNDRELMCILTALIFASMREDLNGEENTLDDIREAVRHANDILVEVDEFENSADEGEVAEVEVIPPGPRRLRSAER